MSFSISQNEASPRAKNSAVKPLPRANFSSANTVSTQGCPTFQGALGQDQVRFGEASHKPKSPEAAFEITGLDATKPVDSKQNDPKTKNDQSHAYSHRENNIREAARIVLCDIAPLALSILPLIGIPGFGLLFGIATLPLSYLSGKLGRKVAKDVNPDDLNPAFKYVHQVKHILTQKHDDKNGSLVDNLNKATDDLLNVRNMPAFVTTTLLPRLKVKQGSWSSKILTRMNGMALMRAEVNIRLAQAENSKDAGKAMFNGVKDFAVYSAMNKLGTAMVTSSVPGAKWAGEVLKNAAWVKIAADLLRTKEGHQNASNAQPAPT